jgi:4-hydroxy-tetrahydrodipicolinate synthase
MTRLHGIVPYLVSPIDPETGAVRTDVLTRLVTDLVAAGVHGVSPLGTTGETPYLTAAQRAAIVETTVVAAGGRVPVVPGVVATATADAVEQALRYQEAGAAALVVIRQPGLPTSEAGIEAFYLAVADAVEIPLVLYTNPGATGVDIPFEVIRRLAAHPQINYLKDASGVTGRVLDAIVSVGDDLQVFSASAHIPAVVLRLGGVGWMAGPACAIPRASVALYDLAVAGEWDAAFELQRVLWPINQLFQRYGIAACVKAAVTLRGYDVGPPLAPQTPLSPAATAEIAAALAAIDERVAP